MYTVIAYKEALDGQQLVRVYDDSTEKSFESKENADAYSAYLYNSNVLYKAKNTGVDMYEKQVYSLGQLDIDELKKQDALNKLTEEEKQLLGIQ